MEKVEKQHIKRSSRKKIVVISGSIVFSLFLYFYFFSPTEINILHHMTEVNKEDGVVDQICLVKNPPYFSSTLETEIEEFDKIHPVKGKYFRRLFVKEHDYIFFASLFLQENVDYELKNKTRADLDNIDFLANSTYQKIANGKILREIYIRTGELWYYKD